ncbi:MAG: hypothetical protein QOJ02_2827 [Acidobacteriota bacterium]|jgi:hypothetical protein|nr:hypothetical protein [Acidobacteriota bacterium]
MSELRYTLLSDGSSDRALIPLLTWLLREHGVERAIQSEWADLWRLPSKPRGLIERILRSIELYPCDLLFVHRDAERDPHNVRVAEIQNAIADASRISIIPPVVCVIPVRMQEAWLLFDEMAIRRAAGNPNGHQLLRLPKLSRIEGLPDPKNELHDLLRKASGLKGRRLAHLVASRRALQVSSFISDFAPLRALSAFNSLEDELQRAVIDQCWNS